MKGLAILIGGAALAAGLSAQAAETGEVMVASAAEITVTATRNPTRVFTYPGSVSVIDRSEIDNLMVTDVADIFRVVPGVQFDGGPRRTGEVPSVRGIGGAGVLIQFDGVRQSFVSGHDGRFFIDADLLKSAEVVRGPASAIYGSGALGGVISFRTLDAADVLDDGETAAVQLRTGYQDVNGEWMGGASAFLRSPEGAFDGVGSLTYRDSGDIELGDGSTLPSKDKITNGLLKGTIEASDALQLSASWMGFRNDALEPNNGQGVSTGDLVSKDVSSDLFRGGLSFGPQNNRWIDLDAVVYGGNTEVEESEVASPRIIAREVESWGGTLVNRSRVTLDTADVVFTYGGEYDSSEQAGRDNAEPDGTRGGVPNAESLTTGLFAQAEVKFTGTIGTITFIPAIRRDDFKNEAVGNPDLEDGATSPKAGLSYQPVPWLLVFGNYAEAFRAPTFDEIYADGTHFAIPLGPGVVAVNSFIPNPNLRSEDSETWEFGAGLEFHDLVAPADHFTIKGAHYRTDATDLIDLEVDFEFSPSCFVPSISLPCTAGTSRYVNTHNAELDGTEIEAFYESERFDVSASYSTIDGKDKATGLYVGILTPDRYNLDAAVKFPGTGIRAGARAEFAAEFDKVNTPSDARDSYTVYDLYASWIAEDGVLEGLRFDIGVDNVADEDYERVFAGVPEPGRNFKAGVKWTKQF